MEGFYAEKSREPPERTDPLCGGTCLFRQGEHGKSEKGGMRKDADFTGKIKSAVAGGGRNRYNKDSVFLSLDIEETTGGQYADNRNQRNMDSTLCKIIIG